MFLVFLALPISIFAQTDPANDLWRERARGITEDLIADGSKLPDSDKYGCYFVLLRLVVKYDPAAASTALKEAIASLNRAGEADQNKDQKTLNSGDLLRTLPAPLLEMDEFAVKDGLASISSVETRAQLRLDLLQATLGRIKTQ